jgi:hypothetical protein
MENLAPETLPPELDQAFALALGQVTSLIADQYPAAVVRYKTMAVYGGKIRENKCSIRAYADEIVQQTPLGKNFTTNHRIAALNRGDAYGQTEIDAIFANLDPKAEATRQAGTISVRNLVETIRLENAAQTVQSPDPTSSRRPSLLRLIMDKL